MSEVHTTDMQGCEVDLEDAFGRGWCVAYDDLGIDEAPWYFVSSVERDAWKRGLEAGYADVKAYYKTLCK